MATRRATTKNLNLSIVMSYESAFSFYIFPFLREERPSVGRGLPQMPCFFFAELLLASESHRILLGSASCGDDRFRAAPREL